MKPAEAREILTAWARGEPRALPAEACPNPPQGASWPLNPSQRAALYQLLTQEPKVGTPPPLPPLWLPPP